MTKKQMFILAFLALIIAIIFLAVPPKFLSIFYFRLVATCFILMGLTKLSFSNLNMDHKELLFNVTEGSLGLILGVIYFHFFEYLTIDIICFILLSIIPIVRLIYASNIINQVSFDLLKYIGLFSLLGGYYKLSKGFFIFFGCIWLLIMLVIIFVYLKGRRKVSGEEN